MDGDGRVAQSLTPPPSRRGPAVDTKPVSRRRRIVRGGSSSALASRPRGRRRHPLVRRFERLINFLSRLPRHTGLAAAFLVLAASAGLGTVQGGHVSTVVDALKDVRDMAANAVGFNIATVALTGQKHLSREEILATAGVTGRASLLFLDVADARARLLTNPWIAEATVQKLLPDRLAITITEREAFALWQKSGRVGVIAGDGTVLEPYVMQRYMTLPLVVGIGAETRAKDFLALLDRFPQLRDNVRAAVFVADRRWNLRLKNGVDIRLPEFEVEPALAEVAKLEHDLHLSNRDITSIDLRLPDRVTVQLSDAAAQARDEAWKKKQQKTKGGNA